MCAPNSITIADLSIRTVIQYATFALRLESLARTSPQARASLPAKVNFKLKSKFRLYSNEASKILPLHHLPGGRWIIGLMIDGDDYVVHCWDAHITPDASDILQPVASFRYERAVSEDRCCPELIPQHDDVSGNVSILCAFRDMNEEDADGEGDIDSEYVLFRY